MYMLKYNSYVKNSACLLCQPYNIKCIFTYKFTENCIHNKSWEQHKNVKKAHEVTAMNPKLATYFLT